jgi:hypothetical protein
MSQENVELVAARLRAFQATLRITEQTAPDFVWDMSTLEGWPDAREYFGGEGFNEFFAKWTAAASRRKAITSPLPRSVTAWDEER